MIADNSRITNPESGTNLVWREGEITVTSKRAPGRAETVVCHAWFSDDGTEVIYGREAMRAHDGALERLLGRST